MAFHNDALSCGFSPDFCSPCSANDCHGKCICPPDPPKPGNLCDSCSGTGCPKCLCVPAPQQTFLTHTRLSFPKCTCKAFPKQCMKCCRKRLPCDCLPGDCEEMSDTQPRDTQPVVCDTCQTQDCNCNRPVVAPCGTGNRANKSTNSTGSSRKRRLKSRRVKKLPRKKKASRKDVLCCMEVRGQGEYDSPRMVYHEDEDLGGRGQGEYELPRMIYHEDEDLGGPNPLGCDPEREICSAKGGIEQKKGPCCPPHTETFADTAGGSKCCESDCSRPYITGLVEKPCGLTNMCHCNHQCKKENCMIKNGKCLRCSPRNSSGSAKENCCPCGPVRKLKAKKTKKRHPCDEGHDECEDQCEGLFGTCEPQLPCVKECNTGECENACLIM